MVLHAALGERLTDKLAVPMDRRQYTACATTARFVSLALRHPLPPMSAATIVPSGGEGSAMMRAWSPCSMRAPVMGYR